MRLRNSEKSDESKYLVISCGSIFQLQSTTAVFQEEHRVQNLIEDYNVYTWWNIRRLIQILWCMWLSKKINFVLNDLNLVWD